MSAHLSQLWPAFGSGKLLSGAAMNPGRYRHNTSASTCLVQRNFERRRVALGDCGRAYGTSCAREHSCLRCSLLRPDPAQRQRITEIRENLRVRIAEAEKEGWLGEVEGLKVSLAGTEQKLAQLDEQARRTTTVNLGLPAFRDIAGCTALPPAYPATPGSC